MKKHTQKNIEKSKLDELMDKRLKLKEGSKLDKSIDKQEQKILNNKKKR